MQPIYCISGLAADHRLFGNLSIPGYHLVPLPWVPNTREDNMSRYAQKMIKGITNERAIIIGLSFGGMLALEIAKQHPDWKIFIISSAKTSAELGYNSSLLRWVSDKELVPAVLFNIPHFLSLYRLGAHTTAEKKLLRAVIRDGDPAFTRWSINTLLNWNNQVYTDNITHIHGSNDKVILSANVQPDHWIEGGSHIMIYNRAAEVSKIISDCLVF